MSRRHDLGEGRRARLKGSSVRTNNRQGDVAGDPDGSEFKNLG